MMNVEDRSKYWQGVTFGIIAALIWGAFPVLTRHSLENQLGAYDIVALRFMVAGPILLYFFYKTGIRQIPILAVMCLVTGAGFVYLMVVNTGLLYAPASHFGAITPSTMLIFATIGSYIWLKDKLAVAQIIGILCCLMGLSLITWDGMNMSGSDTLPADALFVLGGLMWAAYTIATRYWKIEALHAVAIVSVLSMLIYLPPYFLMTGISLFQAPLLELILQAVFQGIFSVLIALLFYTRAVVLLGAARAAVFAALVPVISLLLAIPVLDEIPGSMQLWGVLMVSMGMLLALNMLRSIAQFRRNI